MTSPQNSGGSGVIIWVIALIALAYLLANGYAQR